MPIGRPGAVSCRLLPRGLIFIVFDALAVFLFPWALALRTLGFWGIGTMLLFLSILSLGWVYAYRERILEWQ